MGAVVNNHVAIDVVNPSLEFNKQTVSSLPLNQIIKKIAISCLKDLVYQLAVAGVCCFFVASAAIPTLFIGAVAIVAFSTLLKMIPILIEKYRRRDKPKDEELEKVVCESTDILADTSLAIIGMTTHDVLIHEAGHAAAAELVYKNTSAKISIDPFNGGVTRYFASVLTPIGKYLGPKVSTIFVAAAGTGATTLLATAQIAVAHFLQKKHPRMTQYLRISAIMTIANNVFYALSTFYGTHAAGHDFMQLWKLGIHPLIPAACMIALPLIVFLILNGFFINKSSIAC